MQSLSSVLNPCGTESQALGRVSLLPVQKGGVLTFKETVEEIICVLLCFGTMFNW